MNAPMPGSTSDRGVTVVLATCDRAAVLSETLGCFCEVDRTGIDADLLVVDNGSHDQTRDVLGSFQHRLPIRYLYEPRHGKNRALNLALRHGGFRPLVVFTDDDVRPARDWLHAILAISGRWPNHKVFGGKIIPAFPLDSPPTWVHDPLIRQMMFASHDLGPSEKPYASTEQPFGPNFWLRREVLELGVQFDESVGPGTGTLGDEVMFLHALQRQGFEIIYSPHASVEHRIQLDAISEQKVIERALMVGRIGPTMYGLCRPEMLDRSPRLWKLLRYIRLNQYRLQLVGARLQTDRRRRLIRSVSPLVNIGYNMESLRLAKQSATNQP